MECVKYTILVLALFINVFSQDTLFDIKKLSVPQASAIQLIDVAPTLLENPTTPKKFAISLIQDFDSTVSWPQNYSAEFTPYWWILPSNRNIYNFLGLKPILNKVTNKTEWREDIFSGLKFLTISTAFVSKDLIPDTINSNQKVVSAGLRLNIIHFHNSQYAESLIKKIDEWHNLAQADIAQLMEGMDSNAVNLRRVQAEGKSDSVPYYRQLLLSQKDQNLKMLSDSLSATIETKINEKPIFAWDFAGAYAEYGVGDTAWETGRGGLWTTATLNLPLAIKTVKSDYLSIATYARFMYDAFANNNGVIEKSSSFDIGGKLSLQFDKIDVGFEGVYRNYINTPKLKSQRAVGFINYCLDDNLYIYGTFGKDFSFDKPKLLTLFGINWGFGHEKIQLIKNELGSEEQGNGQNIE